MKRDTRPTCAICGYVTDGCRCADCPPGRVYCRYHIIDVERISANGEMEHVWLCRECDKLQEGCKLCESLTTHHTPNGVCPRCMRVVCLEAEALAREFSREAWQEAIDDPDLNIRAVQDAIDMLCGWLMRQRAMAMPADALAAENQVEVANGSRDKA